MVSEAKKRASRKWDAANLEQINLIARKGFKDQIIANKGDMSINKFIVTAVEEKIKRLNSLE